MTFIKTRSSASARTETETEIQTNTLPIHAVQTLTLQSPPPQPLSPPRIQNHVQWTTETIDNENLNRKKSNGIILILTYH